MNKIIAIPPPQCSAVFKPSWYQRVVLGQHQRADLQCMFFHGHAKHNPDNDRLLMHANCFGHRWSGRDPDLDDMESA